MEKIHVPATDTWTYFQSNKTALKNNMFLMAVNAEYGVTIYLSEKDGFPYFLVEHDGFMVEQLGVTNEVICEEIVRDLYERYLTDKIFDNENFQMPDKIEKPDIEDIILEREEELTDAVMYLVITATDLEIEEIEDYERVIGDIKEHILEYIARKHELKIRRPMYLEDEDGEDFYEEYPYECMIFEDDDNPIYKK